MAGIGFPDATNTGVPAGVTLTPSGELIINTPGIVIEGLDIRGMVTINADNVTLKNCTISASSWAVINITSGSTGVVIQDCEINGLNAEGVRGISVSGQATLLRNDIHNVEDGIYLLGSNILIQDNYIHGLQSNNSGPHYDGIQTDGGISNVVIRHNTIINDHGQTSAINLSNYFGSVRDVAIDNNRLVGGGYTIYSDGQFSSGGTISGVSITNNDLGKGQYGYTSINNNTPVFTGNYDDITGLLLPGQQAGNLSTVITTFSTDSGTVGDGLTNDNTLTLSGTAAANSIVKVLEGTTQVGQTTADGSGAWSVTTTALPDGSHSFTATATSGGTTSGSSSPLTVRVDTVAPSAPTIASFSTDTGTVGDGITSDNTLTLTGAAAANSAVKLYDGAMLLGTATANGSGSWSYTTGVLSNALHNLTATATDAAGNTGTASSVLAVTVNSTAPTVSINDVTISEGNSGTKVATFTVTRSGGTAAFAINFATSNGTATVADNDYIAASGTLNFGANENTKTVAVTINGDTKVEANQTFNVVLSDATNGATISDGQGVGTITNDDGVDTVAPAKPAISAFSTDTGIKGDGITNDHTLSLTGAAEANSTVSVYDGTKLLGTAHANSTGAWSYPTGTLLDATHSFTATAKDAAGNVSAASPPLAVTVATPGDHLWKVAAQQDFSSDGSADFLWTDPSTGALALWTMQATTVTGGAALPNPGASWHVVGAGDFNGDNKSDILWQGSDGTPALWLMNGTNIVAMGAAGSFNPGSSWQIKGSGDFNGDGRDDILWQGSDGTPSLWLMDGTHALSVGAAGSFNPGPSWQIKGSGDFNGDGKADILWQGSDGTPAIWLMDGTHASSVGAAGSSNPGPSWQIKGSGDFNGDGKSDILWQGSDGTPAIWLMNGTMAIWVGAVGPSNPGANWHVEGTGDFNGDGKSDILWQDDNGVAAVWTMNGTTVTSIAGPIGDPSSDWHLV